MEKPGSASCIVAHPKQSRKLREFTNPNDSCSFATIRGLIFLCGLSVLCGELLYFDDVTSECVIACTERAMRF
jgi:hypothetical protein